MRGKGFLSEAERKICNEEVMNGTRQAFGVAPGMYFAMAIIVDEIVLGVNRLREQRQQRNNVQAAKDGGYVKLVEDKGDAEKKR